MAVIEKRTAADGTRTYRVKVRRKGQPAQTGSFSRLTDAKKWATQTEGAVLEGRHFPSTIAKRKTVAEAIDKHLAEMRRDRPKTAKNVETQLAWWRARIGHMTLAEATPAVMIQCRDELRAGTYTSGKQVKQRSGTTVNRYIAALSPVFTAAMKEWQWIDDNPFRKVSKPRSGPGRVRYLSDDERSRLLAAVSESTSSALKAVVVLALSTGMRSSEITKLRWGQVDLERSWITLDETKNGERRGIPLTGYARELISARRGKQMKATDYVFPGQIEGKPIEIKKAWETALRKAQIGDFRFHDLRHSAASYLAMNGATSVELAAVLGHKTLQMVKRYSHVANDHTSRIVGSMNDKIFGEQVNVSGNRD